MAELVINGNSSTLVDSDRYSYITNSSGISTLQYQKTINDGIYYIEVKNGSQSMTRLDLYNIPTLTSDIEKRLFLNLYPHLIDDLMNVMGAGKTYSIHDVAMACIRRVINESSSTSK